MPLVLSAPGFVQLRHTARNQSRQCGFRYVFRKYLTIALLNRHSEHLAVARSLSLPCAGELLQHHPRAAFKYLHRYLARCFGIQARSTILANHYRYIDSRVRPDFIGRICRDSIPLWQEEANGHRYGIALTYPNNEEGELSLIFTEDTIRLFVLSFAIMPGSLLGLPDRQIAFIGRLQGVADKWESIRRTTKALQDVVPAALLLDAVRAIAASLDIPGIVGVSAANQVCLRRKCYGVATSVYDDFWLAANAYKVCAVGYYLPTQPREKPLSLIPNKHRSRVKRKRQFRTEVAQEVGRTFDRECMRCSATRSLS